MSNNLVSEPMPSVQMAQLEPILKNVDSSGRQMEMGLLGPVSRDPMSQHQGASNDHGGLLRAVPGEPRMHSGRVEAQVSNMGMRLPNSPNKQSMPMGTILNNVGHQQLSATPKRKAPMELSSSSSMTSSKRVAQMGHRPWLQQTSNASSKGSPQMQSPRPQPLAVSSKRKTQQMEFTSTKSGTPRSSNSKSQNTQMKQSSKVQTESSESVRSKMRESLAAALALVSQQDKPPVSNNNTLKDAANTQSKLENNSQCAGSGPASMDTSLEQKQGISQSGDSSFSAAHSDHVMGEGEHRKSAVSNNENILSSMEVLNCDKQDFQSSYTLTTDDVPFSDGFFMKDELLQGNGLSWVLSDMVDMENQREGQTNIEQRSEPGETDGVCRDTAPLPEHLASRIEAELFKLFGVEEVSGGTTSVARSQTVNKDVEATSPSKSDVIKSDVTTDGEKSNLQKDNAFSITISSNDGTDPMQGLMTDDALKDPDFLPPIVSLDEFMESLHSEPPFENLPVESEKVTPISDKDDSGVGSSKSKSSDLTPGEQADDTADKSEKRVNAESGAISSDTRYSESQADMKPTDGHCKERSTDDKKSSSGDAELRASQFLANERYGNDNAHSKTTVPIKGECLWEGMLQVNISTTHSVISIFKSGEKTSTKDWPGFLEIKGRVRLDAFEKFLQELPLSRSRAIMVLHFVSKGSSPDDQSILREVTDSYISDERVGFAETVHGVELYFCPPHKKTVEMLSNILPKEQIEAVNSIDNGLIGIIVWRKTNLTSSISPTTSSHHKHSSKKQYFTRRQQDTNGNNIQPSGGPPYTAWSPHVSRSRGF
ncbi:hypothetical protein SESBI_21548 [Sesbania bispinosa]|nr:hypothetical protein SESBI_21548 [Sesbania bispinosa]